MRRTGTRAGFSSRRRIRNIALLVVALGTGFLSVRSVGIPDRLPGMRAAADAGSQAGCDPRHPSFLYGFAELKQQIGNVMGDPLECEHAIHVGGDTRQTTSTGYAYYRTTVNVPTFTNGWDHWALTDTGLVHWTGSVVDPPGTAASPSQPHS